MSNLSSAYREALAPVLLAFADDELVIGHRHSEWTGWAPHIEEDVAFSSIAQDEIGHAALFYRLLSEIGERSADQYALGRSVGEYRHAQVLERPNRDWAYTLARHYLYDTAERIRLESMKGSSYRPLAEVAEKLLREERYHQLHADAWFRRLTSGPVEGRRQFALALSELVPEAVGLFEPIEREPQALEVAVLPTSSEDLLQEWLSEVLGRLDGAGLPLTVARENEGEVVPTSAGELIEQAHQSPRGPSIKRSNGRWMLEGTFPAMGGRRGKHSEDFDALWNDLTMTYREEPAATW